MSNLERINGIFMEVFSVEESALGSDFNNKSVEEWDSVHQLSLTTSVEDEFGILLDAEDILEFTSYENAKRILEKNGIEL